MGKGHPQFAVGESAGAEWRDLLEEGKSRSGHDLIVMRFLAECP
jgi:hypothetical protein